MTLGRATWNLFARRPWLLLPWVLVGVWIVDRESLRAWAREAWTP